MPSSLRAPWLLLVPMISLVAPVVACRGAAAREPEEIRALVAREVEAFNHQDLKALSEIWSQDTEILLFDVEPPGRYQGWESIGRLFKDFFSRVSDIRLTASEVRVTVDGSAASATYDWAMTGRMGDYTLDDRGQTTSIYRKEKDGWRLIHEHTSSLPAAPAATPTPAAAPAAHPPAQPGVTPAASR